MATDRTNQQIKLKDGRMLGYAEYGAAEGKPVFYFHGDPDSRLTAQFFQEPATRLNVRIIAVDRPGIGISDFQAGRQMLDWPDDVIELADALQLNSFSVMGVSGGGPYVAACAFRIPQRLTTAAIVSGMGTLDMPRTIVSMSQSARRSLWLAGRAPWLFRLVLKIFPRNLHRDPDVSFIKSTLPEPDRMTWERPGVTRVFRESMLEAFRRGTRGVARDYAILARPWGFQLQDISMEVYLWHGESDKDVPPAMARYVASAIPNCHAEFLPEEGHFSLLGNHIEEILTVLTS
jgi:pimeloyl-ACP methyl ester carboxylesterase